MYHEKIDVEIDYAKLGIEHDGNKATMTMYIKDIFPEYQNSFKRPLVIICPGGGYGHHSPREGEQIAIKMLDCGYNAIVLHYSLLPNRYPCAMYELAYTVDYARKHAAEWDVDPEKIVVAGFSAGGHIAASLGTMYKDKEFEDFVKIQLESDCEAIKPNGMLLGYPVITSGEKSHPRSFENLLGERHGELLESVSLEKRVTAATPKSFIWHTFSDGSVPVENSLLFASALREAGVPFELHIFPEGNHGLGLGIKETDTKDGTHYQPEVYVWTELFKVWMRRTFSIEE